MKVCVQYCHGICNPATTAARMACYLVAEQTLGSKLCDLGCGPALEAGVEEDVEFVHNDPVVAVDCCDKLCARRLLEMFSARLHTHLRADDILRAHGFDPDALDHFALHLDHPAVLVLAEAITAAGREVLGSSAATAEEVARE
jgi:uncharacterized metal-binding protein